MHRLLAPSCVPHNTTHSFIVYRFTNDFGFIEIQYALSAFRFVSGEIEIEIDPQAAASLPAGLSGRIVY